jgi:hypothetical protein
VRQATASLSKEARLSISLACFGLVIPSFVSL